MSERCPNCEKLEKRLDKLEKLVMSQQATIEKQQKLIEKQQKLIEFQAEEIKDLKSQVRKGKRQAQPFSKDKANPNPKKPGRKKGQGNFNRQNAQPKADKHIFTPLQACPDCSGVLSRRKRHISYQSDLPEIELEVTCFESESGYCKQCQRRFRSYAPGQIVTGTGSAGHGYGPHLKSLASYLKHSLGLPFRKIDSFFQDVFHASYCASAQIQSEQSQESKFKQQYAEIQKQLRESEQAFVDETGWRVGSKSSWLWVFCNTSATVYAIRSDRSHKVILEQLGSGYKGVMHSDCFAAYNAKELEHFNKQKCLAHLQRELKELADKKGTAKRFGTDLKNLMREAIELYQSKAPPDKVKQLMRRFEYLIRPGRQFTDADNRRILKRLQKLKEQWLQFLSNPNAEPTNNRAERALRPAVIVRKTGRCNKTQRGADLHAMIASVIVTVQQQGKNAWGFLREIWAAQTPTMPNIFADSA